MISQKQHGNLSGSFATFVRGNEFVANISLAKRNWLPVKWMPKKIIRLYWVHQREKMWVLDRELPSVTERRSIPSPLYKALKSGPHGSVHGPPLLPHWKFHITVPNSSPINLVQGDLEVCVPLLSWHRLCASRPPRLTGSAETKWQHHSTAPFASYFLGKRLKMPEPTKKGRNVDNEDS